MAGLSPRRLHPTGDIGRVYSCTRPLVYRALAPATDDGLAEVRATTTSDTGPARTTLASHAARTRGVSSLAQPPCRARARSPLGAHAEAPFPRACRPRLLASPSRPASVLARTEAALERSLSRRLDSSRTLVLWRLSVGPRGALVRGGVLDSRIVEPIVYRPIGLVVSPHTELGGMPLQAIADTRGESRIEIFEPHRGCLEDLDGFSHLWVLAHLHEIIGWDATVPNVPRRRTHGTFATRSPRRPNPLGLSLARIVVSRTLGSSSTVSTSSPARRCSTSSPTSRSSTSRRARCARDGSRAAQSGCSGVARTTASRCGAAARRPGARVAA